MTTQAGHCTKCGAQTWRGIIRPDVQHWVPMWPDPTSLYVVLETAEGLAVGLGYCTGCAPALGEPGPVDIAAGNRPLGPSVVARIDRAPERYSYWFSPKYGEWLAAWVRDELGAKYRFPDHEAEAVRAQWAQDREAVSVHG